MIQSTRTEKDYAVYIKNVIDLAPEAKRIMINESIKHAYDSIKDTTC